MNVMKNTGNGPRLVIVCGLPGSGKTTLAKCLEESLHAVRLAPDEWMDALSINLWDEESRARIEALQWKLGQELLRLGLVVIIEWGTWGRSERDTLREGARRLGAAVELHYLAAPPEVLFERIQRRRMEIPPITARMSCDGQRLSKFQPGRRWNCTILRANARRSLQR
ncbi:MAG: ATP-binding protein [Chloroflexi bacterium]|nr:ATP-binding protein [Chloroflexota bacterium]MBI3158845.1 ATP-binding protein [Chloroflexota bacterium]